MSLILASRATVYDRYAISRKFTAQETAINVVQGNIALLVSAAEIEELKNGNKTMYSRLSSVEMNLNSITLAVSSSEYKDINGVLSAITQARASITLNSQQIELKVSKDNILSSINQSAEAVKIAANKIALTGNGIIDILNTGTTTINAARLNINGIVTANQNFKILSDGSMEAKNGTFSGNIKSSNVDITGGGLNINEQFIVDKYGSMTVRGNNLFRSKSSTIGSTFSGNSFYMGFITDESNEKVSCIENARFLIGMQKGTSGKYSGLISLKDADGNTLFYADSTLGISMKGIVRIEKIDCQSLMTHGTKNRVVETKSFGIIAQSSYETAEPMFGDLGHGVVNEYGECIVFIDPKFAETVSTECGYYVFITKYGEGNIWIKEKSLNTFTISGTPGLEFDWELKAHQKGYEYDRLKKVDLDLK